MTDAKLPGFEERFAEIRGVRMRYFVAGEGPPLVLVHGLGGAASNWTELAPLFVPGRRVLVPDLPGHGGSTNPGGDYSLGAHASWVRDLMVALDIPRATLVGHSLGGGVAMQTAYLTHQVDLRNCG